MVSALPGGHRVVAGFCQCSSPWSERDRAQESCPSQQQPCPAELPCGKPRGRTRAVQWGEIGFLWGIPRV